MDSSFPGFACVFAIGVFFVIPMWGYTMVTEWYARAARARAIEAGRHEPVTIQPFVDLSVCMGSGACVPACPEDVLKVIEGQAFAVNMASCIGHGACVSACPVGAIELVFGSEKRGIEIPFVGPDFQTNVPGVFIAGELGGMGLIANAAEQGVKAMAHATADLRSDPDLVDVVIVGAGPAGISAAASAKRQGHKYVVLEQDELGGAVRHYPRKKLVFTRPMEIPGYPKVNLKTMRKEELVTLFSDVVDKLGLEVSTRERVDRVERREGRGFRVTTSKRTIEAQRVILALGRRGTPRKLKVDGEQLDKVAYSLLEPEQYKYEHLLIVGGGDSAVEAAVALSEQPGNRVTLSYRGDKINRPKEKNIQYLRDAMKAGKVEVLLESQILGITKDRVTLEQKSEQVVIPNDWVFVMVGGVLPIDFLKAVGIKIERHFGKRVEHIEDPAEVHAAAPPPRPSPTETTAEIPRAQGNEEPTLWLGPVPEFGENGELPYDEVPLEAMNEPSGSLSDGFGVGLGSPLAAEPSEPGVPGLARAFVADAERRRAVGDHRGVVRMAEVFRRAAPSAGPGGAAAAPWIDLVEGEARIALGEGPSAVGMLESAVEGFTSGAGPVDRARWALGLALAAGGRGPAARRMLDDARAAWTPPVSSHVDGLRVLFELALDDGAVDRAEATIREAWGLATDADDSAAMAVAQHGLARLAWLTGQPANALEPIALAFDALGHEPAPTAIVPVLIDALEVELVLGRYHTAIHYADVLGGWTADLPIHRIRTLVSRARALIALGRPNEAEAPHEEAYAWLVSHGRVSTEASLGAARNACDLGRSAEAAALIAALGDPPASVATDPAGQAMALRARAVAGTDAALATRLANGALARPAATSPVHTSLARLDAAHALFAIGQVAPARAGAKHALKAQQGTGSRGPKLEVLLALAAFRPDAVILEAVVRAAGPVVADLPQADAASLCARPLLAQALATVRSPSDPPTQPLSA